MRFFAILLSLDHNFFFEIAYDDSLRQCLTSNRGKAPPHPPKIFGKIKFGPKLDPNLGFSPFSQVWFISFPLNYIG